MSEVRVDRSALPRVTRTPEGYLRGEAVATRIGVFQYMNADGTTRSELRHPDDVLASDSIESLKMIPITVDHPGELVTSDNAKDLAVGLTGENNRIDGRHVVVPFTITAKDGIKAVEEGRRELSLGYRLDLVEEDGVYEGEKYTHRQKNIVYNHMALVKQARAGRAARLNLDGASVQIVETDQEEAEMHKVNIDGIQYDAAPEVVRALEKAQADLAKARKDAETLQAKLDAAEEDKKEAEEKAKKAEKDKDEKSGEDAINARVKQRLGLLVEAQKLVNKDVDLLALTDRQIMETAIAARYKDVKLDGKSDDYVRARFDSIVETGSSPAARADKLAAPRSSESRDDAAVMADSWQKSVANLNDWRTKTA